MYLSNAKISTETLGREGQPLVVVDDFFSMADKLAEAAESRPFFKEKRFYPGVRSAAPNQYLRAVKAIAETTFAVLFSFSKNNLISIDSAYSYVTHRPEELSPFQRIPHFDKPMLEGVACVHYLFKNAKFGGTSFYRHKSTGFEFVDESRVKHYIQTLNDELSSIGLPEPPRYINGDTEIFERYFTCKAKFNRAIFYRACMLHSGDINHEVSAQLTENRLTLTTFIGIDKNR